ncbi:MAG: CatB-related O-acetyltransferase [Anaeromyxobacter sp.]|nr:CatB-related O-acetyltransferase [Anaeromyxobacter sp.]
MATSMGRQTYCAFRLWAANTTFGPFCAIGPGVISGIGRHPARGFATSHPAFFSPSWPAERGYAVNPFEEHVPVEIGADVWIGANAFISAGVKIGHGAIVGAGAVVTRDVEPYEIVVGVPAKRLRLRFPEEDVRFLLDLRWWDWPDSRLRALGPAFHEVAALRAAVAGAAEETGPSQPDPARGDPP